MRGPHNIRQDGGKEGKKEWDVALFPVPQANFSGRDYDIRRLAGIFPHRLLQAQTQDQKGFSLCTPGDNAMAAEQAQDERTEEVEEEEATTSGTE